MSDTTNTRQPSDAETTPIIAVGLVGIFLAGTGVIGLVGMAGQAIYESYGLLPLPLPLLTLSLVVGLGLVVKAKRMVNKLQGALVPAG